ncbi:MAG: NlpC/P60 family protein, partial [Bacilli bacterium]
MDEELTPEEIEAQQQAALDARSNQTNTKIVKTGAKAAANYFTGGKGGEAVEIASKTRAGGAILEAGGEALTAATKKMPMGGKIQEALNTADDAGAIDQVDKAMSGGKGGVTSAAGSSPGSSPKPSLTSLDSQSGESSPGLKAGDNSQKKMIMIGMIPIALILIIIITTVPNVTISLTSGDGVAHASSSSSLFLTDEQIENKLIYVGDERIVGMNEALNNVNITYIAETAKGYYWFDETALPELSAYISSDTQKYVVIALGINDLTNIDNYIAKYSHLKNSYKNVKFYFLEIGPIDEALALENGFTVNNNEIDIFNQKLKTAFQNEFIELDSEVKNNLETTDGVHYSSATSSKIHETVLKNIRSKNSITFSEEYPTVDESKVIKDFSITDAIGASGVNILNSYIYAQIQAGGECTSGGVVGAAIGLIYGLHIQGYHLDYYYGGGHNNNNNGVDLKWGTNVGPSIPTPRGNVNLYGGLDCSGFIAWAMNTAGVRGGTVASGYTNYGTNINYEELSPGDLLVKSDHVIMVIEPKDD